MSTPTVQIEVAQEIRNLWQELDLALKNLDNLVVRSDGSLPAYAAVLPYATVIGEIQQPRYPYEPTHVRDGFARQEIGELLRKVTYEDDQDRNSTVRMPGLVACSEATYRQILEVNSLKAKFRAIITELGPEGWQQVTDGFGTITKEMARAVLLQTYRQVNFINRRPDRVSFSWQTKTSAIQRVTVDEARELIEKSAQRTLGSAADDVSRREQSYLHDLPDTEILAVRRPPAVAPICNFWFGSTAQAPLKAALPLFYLATDPKAPLPPLTQLSVLAVPPALRGRRSDAMLEEQPLVHRVHLYRYLLGHRHTESHEPVRASLRLASRNGSVHVSLSGKSGAVPVQDELQLPASTVLALVGAMALETRHQTITDGRREIGVSRTHGGVDLRFEGKDGAVLTYRIPTKDLYTQLQRLGAD